MKSFGLSRKDSVVLYYKVVTEVNGVLGSAFVGNKAKVEYIPDVWVKAPLWLAHKGYHLFVFDNLKIAEYNAVTNVQDTKAGVVMFNSFVYSCEVQGVYSQLPQYLNRMSLWDGKVECSTFELFPLGTVMVQKVKLLEEVKKWIKKQ